MGVTSTVRSTSRLTPASSLVSTWMLVASPCASRISRSTVLIVDAFEFGSGGNAATAEASDVLIAATTTADRGLHQLQDAMRRNSCSPAYPFCARSTATCRPIPLEAPITRATCHIATICMCVCGGEDGSRGLVQDYSVLVLLWITLVVSSSLGVLVFMRGCDAKTFGSLR